MSTVNKNSVSYSHLMKCTWHSSIAGMKAYASLCPLRLISSHWFLARHLLTPAKVQMQFKCSVGTCFLHRSWHGVVNSSGQWMSSQVVYSNSETYFLSHLTSRLLVKLNNRSWRVFPRAFSTLSPVHPWEDRQGRPTTNKHHCSTRRAKKKEHFTIIPFKMASALDPLLQEIKFQNGPRVTAAKQRRLMIKGGF